MLEMIKNCRVESLDGGKTKITGECRLTGTDYSVTVDEHDFMMWRRGLLIQKAMPYLNTQDLEFLISGCTPAEWNRWFGNEEKEDYIRENPVDREIREES